MKKTLLTLICLLSTLSNIIAAEYEYTSLVRENVEWGYTYSASNYIEPDIENEYYKVRFFGDIEVDGKNYKKAYKYDTEIFNESTATLVAYMRDENKKIYMIPVEYGDYTTGNVDAYVIGNEYQTYDFSLNVGDATPRGRSITDGDIISNIEDIEINNINRKLFITEVNDSIIEGMGVIGEYVYCDFIFPFVDLLAATNVRVYLNYERDLTTGEIVYITESADYDDPALSGVKGVVNDKVEAVVTHDGQMLNVTTPNSRCKSVRVLNISGELVRNITCDGSSSQVAIPTETLPTAIYIIIVETDNCIATAKVSL